MVEGTADYIRWFKHESQSHGADEDYLRQVKSDFRFDDSQRLSAYFLNWVTEKHDHALVVKMNTAMRQGQYDDSLWKNSAGKTVQELARNGKRSPKQRGPPVIPRNQRVERAGPPGQASYLTPSSSGMMGRKGFSRSEMSCFR
jgi:hypothetical protein